MAADLFVDPAPFGGGSAEPAGRCRPGGRRREAVGGADPVQHQPRGAGRAGLHPGGRLRRPPRRGPAQDPGRLPPPPLRQPRDRPGDAARLPPRQLGRDPRPRPGKINNALALGGPDLLSADGPAPDRPAGRLLRDHRLPGAGGDGRRAGRRRRPRRPADERPQLRGPLPARLAPHDRRPGAGLLPEPHRRRPGRPQPLGAPGPGDALGAGQDAGRGGRRRRGGPLDLRAPPVRQARRPAEQAPPARGAGPPARPGPHQERRRAGPAGLRRQAVGRLPDHRGRPPVRGPAARRRGRRGAAGGGLVTVVGAVVEHDGAGAHVEVPEGGDVLDLHPVVLVVDDRADA